MSSIRRWVDTASVMDGMQVAGYYMHTNSTESRINFEFSLTMPVGFNFRFETSCS